MKKAWIVLPLALLVMAGVMYAAVSLDCVRIHESLQAELATIDAERVTLEKRYVELAAKHEPQAGELFSPETRNFPEMIKRFRARTPTSSQLDTTPELRHYRDEAAGVISRWEAVDEDYRRVETELREYLRSARGSIAKKYAPAG
jgi:hypothetical protein